MFIRITAGHSGVNIFFGIPNFSEIGFTGVYEKLGIKPIYATPYNARAKVIERFFLDFQESN